MRAYVLRTSGGPKVLQIKEVEDPQINDENEVLVRVKTIGVNYAEVLSRKGQYSWAPPKPYTPGMECYGIVEAVGKQVTTVKVGDEVIVGAQYGCYAEQVIAPQHMIFKSFPHFNEHENAAVLVNYITSWVALSKQARLGEGELLLVQAAAGGVGTAAVQLGKAFGARVIGTAGNEKKCQLIERLGADKAVNYLKEDFYSLIEDRFGGVDVVLEVVGGEVFRKSMTLLNPFGRMCIAGYASIPLRKTNPLTYWRTWKDAPKANIMNMAKGSQGIFATHIGYLTQNQALVQKVYQELFEFLIQNEIRPVVGQVFPFEEIPHAHELMQSRQSHGKIVIQVY